MQLITHLTMLRRKLAAKRSTFVRNPYKRTYINYEDEDDEVRDIIINKTNKKINIICNVHESILDIIQYKLGWNDLASLKQTCTTTNNFIKHNDIIDRMIADMDLINAFCTCIIMNNELYLELFLDNFNIPRYQLINCLIYTICTGRNTISRILIDSLDFVKYSNRDDIEIECECHKCNHLQCFSDFVENELYFENISQKMLLQIACMFDNLEMFKYIMEKYDLEFTYIDIWATILHNSVYIFDEMIRINPMMKLSQRMLKNYVFRIVCGDKFDFLDYLFKNKIAHLGIRLNNAIIEYCLYNFEMNSSKILRKIIMLVENYGSDHMVQTTMTNCIFACYPKMIREIISVSKRLLYKKKFIDMIEKKQEYWTKVPEIEFMIVNKLKLQERSKIKYR